MIIVLSLLLIFFNDPIYAATILVPNRATSFISTVFLVNFVTYLMLFWMVTSERMASEGDQMITLSFKKYKFILALVLWIFMISAYVNLSYLYF